MKTTFTISENSPVRSSLRENHNTGKGEFNTQMISREESPTWSTRIARSKELDLENEELPSWDALEATLNRRLCNYGDALPESLESVEEKLRYERTTREWPPSFLSPLENHFSLSTRRIFHPTRKMESRLLTYAATRRDASCVHRLRRNIQHELNRVYEFLFARFWKVVE